MKSTLGLNGGRKTAKQADMLAPASQLSNAALKVEGVADFNPVPVAALCNCSLAMLTRRGQISIGIDWRAIQEATVV
jgi:hypothetical protein